MDLNGITVWVTRPADQAHPLCGLIEAAGGEAIRFPVMDITVIEDTDQAVAVLENAVRFSHVIFISGNAVRFARQLVPDLASRLKGALVFAVGKGTEEVLQQTGIGPVYCGGDQGGSEGLLELEALNGPAIATAPVLIVRGAGGREVLGEELKRRGAEVRYAEVYRRRIADKVPGETAALWRDHKPDVIVVTSVEGLHNLVELTGENYREELLKTDLAVISDRVKEAAQSLGFVSESVVAEAASDDGLLRAILKCAESRHHEHRKQ